MENNALKPARCGCGGEPVVGHIKKTSYLPKDRWYIGCPDCDICTGLYDTEAEAITAWNRAMSGIAEKSSTVERTAKVEKVDTNSPHSQVYKCCKCGQYTHRTAWSRDVHYCPSCGARLEWE